MHRVCVFLAAVALLLGLATAAQPHARARAAPRLLRLDGVPAPAAAASGVLLFWRADCGPCLLELSDLAALRAAARPGRLTLVGLQPAAALRPVLRRLGLSDGDTTLTMEDPARLLVRLGGAPPRLPLAVAVRADGSLCDHHAGLLGRDRVRSWARSCGGPRADD